MALWSRLLSEESGQAVMEYVIIVAAISIVAIAMIQSSGNKTKGVWNTVNNNV